LPTPETPMTTMIIAKDQLPSMAAQPLGGAAP